MKTRSPQLRHRCGAVLILVIVLLVLMALMGIAYMASARVDRVGASQNVVNTQIDLLVEGARNIVQGLVISDLYGTEGVYRRPETGIGGYRHWDSPHDNSDPWLASRLPVSLGDLAISYTGAGAFERGDIVEHDNRYYLCHTATSSIPQAGDPQYWILLTDGNGNDMGPNYPVWPYLTRVSDAPTFQFKDIITDYSTAMRQLAFPIIVNANGVETAGIRILTESGLYDFLGADADGDGIADSMLFPMTLSEQDGVRYFAAIRIIDNNSALNALTAHGPAATERDHFFPSSIDLSNMPGVNLNGYAQALGASAPTAEALWLDIGRRLEMAQVQNNLPGHVESMMLAHRFILQPRDAAPSVLGDYFPGAFQNQPTEPYLDPAAWWNDLVNTNRMLRPLLVLHNPVSNAIQPRSIAGVPPRSYNAFLADMADYGLINVKTSINTAEFEELFLAFWSVIVEGNAIASDPPARKGADGVAPMFRDPLRWPVDLRDDDDDDPLPTDLQNPQKLPGNLRVLLRAALAAVNAMDMRDEDDNITVRTFMLPGSNREITIYGTETQPFITEVLVERLADAVTDQDFVAIELFNPHDVPINLTGWKLATMDRTLGENDLALPLHLEEIADLGSVLPQIEPGFVVLRNRDRAATEVPVPVAGNVIEIPRLWEARGKELVILRPVISGTTMTNLHEMVPIDQMDLTELTDGGPNLSDTLPQWYHYARSTGNWEWVFPGRYSASSHEDTQEPDPVFDRHFDLRYNDLRETANLPATLTLGDHNTAGTASPRYAIQLNQPGWAGDRTQYPYGGFARNGDILKVPFIGAYKVRPTIFQEHEFIELNSVVMDAAMADDPGPVVGGTPPPQAVGRFAPMYDPTMDPAEDNYAWAVDLLDYLTVQAPHDDYTYPPPGQPLQNTPSALGPNVGEKLVGVQGLININTAPWRVLATLPFVPGDSAQNEAIARAIVTHRRTHGPYRTLFDLLSVPEFRTPPGLPANPNPAWGDFEDDNDPPDDFERRYLMLTRVSNLVTTRSDTFTAYVLVQGWRGSGTSVPELVAERRIAFTLDRNPVTQTQQSLILRNIPQD